MEENLKYENKELRNLLSRILDQMDNQKDYLETEIKELNEIAVVQKDNIKEFYDELKEINHYD